MRRQAEQQLDGGPGRRRAIDYAVAVRLRPNTQRLLLAGLAVAAAIAAVAANWALLGYAQSSDTRIGKLSPKATLVGSGIQPVTGGAGVQPSGGATGHPAGERADKADD